MALLVYSVSCLMWCSLYHTLCTHVLPFKSAEWNCRLVTLLHAIIAVVACFISAFICGPFPITQPGGVNNILEDCIMNFSLAYFTFDITWCIWHNSEGVTMLTHHIVSITGMLLSLHHGVSGTEVIGCIGGSELTNPLLQIRWFLRQSQQHPHYPVLYESVEIAFVFVFGFVRCGVGTVFLVYHMFSPVPMLIFKFCGVAMYIVSWAFYIQILSYARRKYMAVWRERNNLHLLHTSSQTFWDVLINMRRHKISDDNNDKTSLQQPRNLNGEVSRLRIE